jgi:hypothetical protein
MQPPREVSIGAPRGPKPPPPVSELVGELTGAITKWYTTANPSTVNGTFLFTLTIMSNLTTSPSPLLTLTDLELPNADIIWATSQVHSLR